MVIDCVMQVGVPASGFPVTSVVFLSGLSAEHAMPTAVGDTTKFLDVDMHQLTWCMFLVAHDPGPSRWQPGRLINVSE
jgi:hypothetical protein